tara:strand:- start:16 stop:762 length:747 start_codon:yes stop_codon:yes gene_type:complete
MKILLYNPNTSISITNTLFDTANLVISHGTELVPMTAQKGFPYISNKAEAQIAGGTVLEVLSKYHNEFDAVIIAAFGDPGLIAAREMFDVPIVGLGESAMLSACLFGKKFSVISFSKNMSSWYEESVEILGLQSRYSGFRAIDGVVLSIDEIQSLQKEALINAAKDAIEIDGADVIIFAGAPLSGFKKFVEKEISVPIIDCAEAAIKQAELAVTMAGKILNKKRNFKLPPKNSNGLEENLAKYISHNL